MLDDVLAHELPEHLGGGLILSPACFQELVAQLTLNPYAKTGIFHWARV
jgi:hypothetical protein